MLHLYENALAEVGKCLGRIDPSQFEAVVDALTKARRIALYGVGREGLQIKGLAMRLFHLGLQSSVVGDMTTPAVEKGDLLIVSAGPGDFSTVSALIGVAREAGARVLVITAQAEGAAARKGDLVLHVPAQTMANDQGATASVMPMGSLYEGALYIAVELLVLAVRDRLKVSPAVMRANHTNLE
ncbi:MULTISPECIES: SIS domain-containing protein [unclassified Rhizobium]|uniref:SIS domain-containing protein n=1 Tax=unclassified Rhizobium TaxID=2613769 RepID=UPI0024791402|nr:MULTISPECIES: SIS domain-containing protein [unclassified Rhizobium]MDH7803276.1 6-phospho-3-hexuloisomerase [Rhizobium sp. AN70]